MAAAGAGRDRVAGERRVFSLVLALVASTAGLTKREIFESVYGYAERYRPGVVDDALERQFERDKEQLRELGIPLDTLDSPLESGNNQLTRYRIPKTQLQMPAELRFSAQELAVLRLAALAWEEGSLTADARHAIMKLEALGAGLNVQRLGVAPRLGLAEPAAQPLQRAIDACAVVEFDYHLPERTTPLRRRVAPLRLHQADGRWHLIGHDLERDDDRVFLLRRISGAVRVSAAVFDASLKDRSAGVIARLADLEHSQRATLAVRRGSLAESRMLRRGGTELAAAAPAERDAAREFTRYEIGTLDYRELAKEVAAYGPDAVVEAPASLRAKVVQALEAIAQQHRGDPPDAAAVAAFVEAQLRTTPAAPRTRGRTLQTPDRVVLLLALVPYLLEHGDTPVVELAAAFNVAPKVLRELFAFLGTAGIPGETNTYQDEDLFDIDWDALFEHDIARLTRVVAVDDAPRFSVSEYATLLAGLHSVTPMLPLDYQDAARAAGEKLARAVGSEIVAPSISVAPTTADARLAVLTEAIETGRSVSFDYRALSGAESHRTVQPLLLAQGEGGWYLRAFCLEREAERTFLVDGIRNPQLGAPFSAMSPPTAVEAVLAPGEHELPAVVRCSDAVLSALAAFTPHAVTPADAGEVRCRIDLSHAGSAIRIIQHAPGAVIVEHPAAARAAIAEWASRALAGYDR